MMEKLYPLFLILSPIIKVLAFQIFISVSITFVAINHEEMLKKDLASNRTFFEVNAVAMRTKSPFND